jgi:hypothetical protein
MRNRARGKSYMLHRSVSIRHKLSGRTVQGVQQKVDRRGEKGFS